MFGTLRKTAATLAAVAIITLLTGERWASAATSGPDQQKQELQTLVKMVEELSHRVGALEQKLDQIERNQHATVNGASQSARETKEPIASTDKMPPKPSKAASEQPVAAPAPTVPATANTASQQPAVPSTPVTTKATPGGEEPVKLTPKESWTRLKEGMTQQEVQGLLGQPSTTFKLSGQTVWYYYYRDVGTGSVFFYDDGHVASRQKPPFSGWHW